MGFQTCMGFSKREGRPTDIARNLGILVNSAKNSLMYQLA
jgi:hypothetical protein